MTASAIADDLSSVLELDELSRFRHALNDAVMARRRHGREEEWDSVLAALPPIRTDVVDLSRDAVTIGDPDELPVESSALADRLKAFMPWRKGPWRIFGMKIDTEWRSDMKWQRLQPHLSPLAGRSVLDIGCGNGYYMLRARGEGARFCLGIDPTIVFLYQFHALTGFIRRQLPVHLLPLRSEELPAFGTFDTVLSMGVLYHRRSPLDHLTEVYSFLRPGGELILETLVVDGGVSSVLVPEDRYAKMANVWSLPATATLETWLAQAGFTNVRTVDVTRTTTAEQRATAWMTFQSLADFLDPADPARTVEGLPAPTRAIVIANK